MWGGSEIFASMRTKSFLGRPEPSTSAAVIIRECLARRNRTEPKSWNPTTRAWRIEPFSTDVDQTKIQWLPSRSSTLSGPRQRWRVWFRNYRATHPGDIAGCHRTTCCAKYRTLGQLVEREYSPAQPDFDCDQLASRVVL